MVRLGGGGGGYFHVWLSLGGVLPYLVSLGGGVLPYMVSLWGGTSIYG